MAFPCPACHSEDTDVIDTRVRLGRVYAKITWHPKVWRRRRCLHCAEKFTTFESICGQLGAPVSAR